MVLNTFVRIDNRLVHGQILEGWVPFLGVSRIVIVNDEVANDIFRESVIRMVVPSNIELEVYEVNAFAQAFPKREIERKKIMVLFSDIKDVMGAYNAGFRFQKLNVGNVHGHENKICFTRSIFLSEHDITDLVLLVNSGVKVEVQGAPGDNPVNFSDIMKKI